MCVRVLLFRCLLFKHLLLTGCSLILQRPELSSLVSFCQTRARQGLLWGTVLPPEAISPWGTRQRGRRAGHPRAWPQAASILWLSALPLIPGMARAGQAVRSVQHERARPPHRPSGFRPCGAFFQAAGPQIWKRSTEPEKIFLN